MKPDGVYFRRKRAAETFEADLRRLIASGQLKTGDMVMSVREICRRYRCSIGTVQKSQKRLQKEGLIRAERGRGVFVAAGKAGHPVKVYLPASSVILAAVQECARRNGIAILFVQNREEADIWSHSSMEGALPLNDRLSPDLLNCQNWVPGSWTRCRQASIIRGIPVYASPMMLFYNMEHFERAHVAPPDAQWRWADLLTIAKKIKQHGLSRNCGIISFMDHLTYFLPFIYQNHGSVYPKPGHRGIADPRSLEAIWSIRELLTEGGILCANTEEMLASFLGGQSAICIYSGYLAQKLSQTKYFPWACVPLPRGKTAANIVFSEGLYLPRSSANADNAFRLMTACLADEAQEYFLDQHFPFPTGRKMADEFCRRHGGAYRAILDEMCHVETEYRRHGPAVYVHVLNELNGLFDPAFPRKEILGKCRAALRLADRLIKVQREMDSREDSLA